MSVLLRYIRWSKTLTIVREPKLVSEITLLTASWPLPVTIDGRDVTPSRINHVNRVIFSYCGTLANDNTLNQYEFISSQLSAIRFVSPRASETAQSYTHWVHDSVTITANDRSRTWLSFIGAKDSVICHWAFLPYIELRASCTTQHMKITTPVHGSKKVWSE